MPPIHATHVGYVGEFERIELHVTSAADELQARRNAHRLTDETDRKTLGLQSP